MLKKNILSLLLVVAVAALFMAFIGDTDLTKAKRDYIKTQWDKSGHADITSEAFVHWDEDDPRAVSTSCAKCHSTEGLQQFLIDGSVHTAVDLTAVEAAGKKNSIRCEACHTDENGSALRDASAVTFPGSAEFEISEPGAICMQCHMGRQSKADVDSRIAGAGNITDDTPSSKLSFRNVHYKPAAAVQMGTLAKVGYEYAGKSYDARFSHVTGYNDCVTCHDSHTTHIKEHNCATCHTFTDPKDIRYLGSCLTDYDGDGNLTEGIYYEIETIVDKVYAAFLAYTKDIIKKPAVYDAHTYPYFFNDNNANGVADSSEANYGNQYRSWTPRSLRASFNYQMSQKDHAAFAHGGKYLIQLLYDTLEDLNSALGAGAVSMANMHRGDEGHFDGSTEAWRHWDGDGAVPGRCAKCHSATGLATFFKTGANDEDEPLSNGMLCTTCHSSPPSLIRGATAPVTMPSGMVITLGDSSNLCMNCHSGRASMKTIDAKIASPGPYSFTNIHYFPVAAIFFGTEAKGGYEYTGKHYAGRRMFPNHVGKFTTCVECHMNTKGLCDDCPTDICNHNVHKPDPKECVLCHGNDPSEPNPGSDPTKFKFSGIRPGSTPDYNANGNMRESVKNEIRALEAVLLDAVMVYASTMGQPILYDSHSYPYWFKDKNGNGIADPGEVNYGNQFRGFDAKLLKAAYNYHTSIKEPHGYIHNSLYVAQLLVDSIADLGGNVSAYTWR